MKKLRKFFSEKLRKRNPYTRVFSGFFDIIENLGGKFKVLITLFILGLALADYFTIIDLFSEPQYDFTPEIEVILSIVVAAALEGLPCLVSNSMCKLLDTNIKEKFERKKQMIVFLAGSVATIAIFVIVILFRLTVFLGNLGVDFTLVLEGLKEESATTLKYLITVLNYENFSSADLFLMVEPIITSIFAFLLFMGYTSSDHISVLRRNVEKINRAVKKLTFNKSILKSEARTMKQELWNELGIKGEVPDDIDDFSNKAYSGIKQKMTRDGINAFLRQTERFNLAVETELQACLVKLSKLSSIPLEITALDIREIIREYDNEINGPDDPDDPDGSNNSGASYTWSYNKCIKALADKFTQAINYDFDKSIPDEENRNEQDSQIHSISEDIKDTDDEDPYDVETVFGEDGEIDDKVYIDFSNYEYKGTLQTDKGEKPYDGGKAGYKHNYDGNLEEQSNHRKNNN